MAQRPLPTAAAPLIRMSIPLPPHPILLHLGQADPHISLMQQQCGCQSRKSNDKTHCKSKPGRRQKDRDGTCKDQQTASDPSKKSRGALLDDRYLLIPVKNRKAQIDGDAKDTGEHHQYRRSTSSQNASNADGKKAAKSKTSDTR